MGLYVLGDLPEAQHARIAAHVAGCASCGQAEQEYRLLVCEIQFSASDTLASESLTERVRSGAAREIVAERKRLRLRRFVAVASSAAAVVLLGLGVWGAWRMMAPAPSSDSSRMVGVSQEGAPPSLPEKWRYDGARAVPSSLADGVVVQGSNIYLLQDSDLGQRVAAIDVASGARRWQSQPLNLAYLSADASHVFGLTGGGGTLEVVALAAVDGKELWRYSHARGKRLVAPHAPLPLPGGRLCWTHAGTVHVLDADTGAEVWTRSLLEEGPLSAAVADGEDLYVMTGESLYCLHRETGQESWREPLGSERAGFSRPLLAVADGHAYFLRAQPGRTGRLFCMNLSRRTMLWSRPATGAHSLLATSDGVYIRGQAVVALDRRTGEPLWQRPALGCGPLTVIDGLIHFVDSAAAGRLVALDPRTGRLAWEVQGIHSCDAFARIGDTGYIKMRDGTVRALAFGGFGS